MYLDAYAIDKYEVTNALYQRFMDASSRAAPSSWSDSQGPSSGRFRVLRGGWSEYGPFYRRTAYRHFNTPDTRSLKVGFRCVRGI